MKLPIQLSSFQPPNNNAAQQDELDRYLNEQCEVTFDVLNWWKLNKTKFAKLSILLVLYQLLQYLQNHLLAHQGGLYRIVDQQRVLEHLCYLKVG